ncbi:MAG: hypothetical protein HYX69_00700 [Planctomycetia bacterium]|nr:hypothetical protein [Planctomycetia bacterium]
MSDADRTATPDAAAKPRDDRASQSNPFSTRHVRPGAIEFVFPPGVDAGQLVATLRASGWWGEITGPHGSGKSTMLSSLMPCLVREGRQPVLLELHDGERSLARHAEALAAAGPASIVIVDGYEQLSAWSKWRLRRLCRRRRWGLVITAHDAAGLPPFFATSVDVATAEAVLARLLPGESPIGRADLREALDARRGNLREALFDLYDLYEERRPRKA